nr:PREDICTED: uncharacterized protein LOC108216927 [Daucus carota subsp. sativus]
MYLKRVFETCKHFMQLQYPLLFPYGDDGFHLNIPLHGKNKVVPSDADSDLHPDETRHRSTVTMREFYAYRLMVRPDEGKNLHLGGRLWQQFVVDAFAAVEQYRLDWLRGHQHIIRSELYKSIWDSIQKGDTNPETLGKKVILPATHTGHPSMFLTMTCNTEWPEIKSMLEYLPGVDVADAPDIVARVFKLKLDQLLHLIKKQIFFGKCIGVMHVIEFQKHGLPHCHMLIWLHPSSRPNNVHDVDKLISAEIPDENLDPIGYNVVKRFMIHGPCGKDYTYSPCMVKGKCGRHFPKKFNGNTFFDDSGFPVYRRRRTTNNVKKKGVLLDNQYVVPYNRELLVRFQCHINLEVCNSSRSLKYLFKYCLKGHDTATMLLRKKRDVNGDASQPLLARSRDEIKNYIDGRYICAAEASWRLLGFDIHYRHPSVERLPVHVEGEKNVTFKNNESLASVAEKSKTRHSKLEGWFEANKAYPAAREFTYQEFPQNFTWKADACKWKPRERGIVFGRLSDVHASSGETFFLRMILMQNKGATSFKALKTVNGVVYKTYKEACGALGLLKDDRQWHVAMSESAAYAMPSQLRQLFVHIISNNQVADPLRLWEQHRVSMADDILYTRRQKANNMSLQLDESEIYKLTLTEIEKLLNDVGKSLRDFSTLPVPDERYMRDLDNRLINDELSHNRADMQEQHDKLYKNLNKEQLNAYESIIQSVRDKKGGVFFVYGSGGCGTTFFWNTVICRLRSEGQIVLPVASSGIAATLLPGGRTAHSRFHIPLKIDRHSIAGIKHGSPLAELIKQTSLIIWDEAPIQHRHAFECVDRSLRDVMSLVDPVRARLPFGGISIVFGGDYR